MIKHYFKVYCKTTHCHAGFSSYLLLCNKMLETLRRGLNFDLSGIYTAHACQPQRCENFFPPECNHVLIMCWDDTRLIRQAREPHVHVRVCVKIWVCWRWWWWWKVQHDKRLQIKTECKSELHWRSVPHDRCATVSWSLTYCRWTDSLWLSMVICSSACMTHGCGWKAA